MTEKTGGEVLRDNITDGLNEILDRGKWGEKPPHPGYFMAGIRHLKDQGVPVMTKPGALHKLNKALENIPDFEQDDLERQSG